mgnify:FL=1
MLECAFMCGATFPVTAEGYLALYQHEALHTTDEDAADRRQAKEDKHYEGP